MCRSCCYPIRFISTFGESFNIEMLFFFLFLFLQNTPMMTSSIRSSKRLNTYTDRSFERNDVSVKRRYENDLISDFRRRRRLVSSTTGSQQLSNCSAWRIRCASDRNDISCCENEHQENCDGPAASTEGGDSLEIRAEGLNGDERLSVRVASSESACLVNGTGVQCPIPPGFGSRVPFEIVLDDVETPIVSCENVLRYAPPIVENVSGCSTSGAGVFIILLASCLKVTHHYINIY